MRNLEDCKAEIFRRSEERIKERKRRRGRVLACCIPLCLLLVAGGIWLRPLLEPMDELGRINSEDYAIPERELGGLAGSTLFGSVANCSSVEITDKTGAAEASRKVTDAKTVAALGDFMSLYFDVPMLKSDTVVEEMNGNESSAGTEKDETTAGQDRDSVIDEYELKVKYQLAEPLADYKLVFRGATGEAVTFRLYENNLYNEENGCVVTLSDTQLTELKAQLAQVVKSQGR